MNSRNTLKINKDEHLEIGGCDTVSLAKSFGTPLYVLDEQYITEVASAYTGAVKKFYGDGEIAYASKAFSSLAMYAILKELGLSADVVSGGEIYCAKKAGFPLNKAYFHGNNKLFAELELAISNKIGCIVIENEDELVSINALAEKYNHIQNVMIRVNPGVEAHTHDFIQTAKVDSKFGIQINDIDLDKSILSISNYKNIRFYGLAFHIGSQIFEFEPYAMTIDIVCNYIKHLESIGVSCPALNVGGGWGVYYTDADHKFSPTDYADFTQKLCQKLLETVSRLNIKKPHLIIEPGRSLVAEAGITLYTVGTIKNIEHLRKYVAIDGGMFDNPRYALYDAKYSAIIANRANDSINDNITLAGKCCESGDLISKDVKIQTPRQGDIIAVFSTGAYNHSMSSNYNKNLVPPVVLVKDGIAEYIVKPQTYDDLLRNDCIPDRFKKETI